VLCYEVGITPRKQWSGLCDVCCVTVFWRKWWG
jgi:NMD protein affecting ribosome stability and mRNA decay